MKIAAKSEYPQRFELLDKHGNVLGKGVRFYKYGSLKFSLPFVEHCRWIKGGKQKRKITYAVL